MAKRSSLVALSFVAIFFAALGMASPLLPSPQPSTAASRVTGEHDEARAPVVVIQLRAGRIFSIARH